MKLIFNQEVAIGKNPLAKLKKTSKPIKIKDHPEKFKLKKQEDRGLMKSIEIIPFIINKFTL